MYADTITVFNRYKSVTGEIWYPTILHGVDLNIDKAAIIAKYGEQSQDTAKLHIKYTVQDGNAYIGGKKYLPPKEWDMQTNDLLPGTITLTGGQGFDFFVVGEWPDLSPISDKEYNPDGFYNYVNSEYDYCFAISSVAMYSLIPHFEVLAR